MTTLELEDRTEPKSAIDWSAVSVDERRELLAVLDRVGALSSGNTEH